MVRGTLGAGGDVDASVFARGGNVKVRANLANGHARGSLENENERY